jgi:hypothetical protein
MAAKARLYHTNRIKAAATSITASSEESSLPAVWIKDQIPTKRWRTKTGWTVVAGFNDKIDFNRGGVKVATIAAATYATGAALATAIVTALEAADATPVWACSYSTSTKKFTISSDLAFTLLFGTGANPTASPAKDLGFAVADTSSATSHTGGTAVYQSRHWLKADLGSALSVEAGIAHSHNLSSTAVVTLQGNASDAWTSPSSTTTLSGSGTGPRIATLSPSATLRYWRLVLDDVQNTAGYVELGLWYAGTDEEPSVTYSTGYTKEHQDLSQLARAFNGTIFGLTNSQPRAWTLEWTEIVDADKDILEALKDAAPMGTCFFIALDATNDLTGSTVYVARSAPMTVQEIGPSPTGNYWTVSLPIVEAV